MQKFFTLMKSGWFVALIGIALLSLIIWFGGPYLGLGSSQPLASPVARLVVILLLVAIWAIWLQVQHLRARGKATRMSGDMAAQGGAPAADAASGEQAQLQARFQEAIGALRKTKRGGAHLYDLPWYMVIGPPGSGKSTLLKNSGLNFPLSGRFGKEALRGVGGTRNCDWWFTDEAVFLDTAGRYTLQESDRVADASAWGEFLKLLRKYRRRRPLNGVLLTMSMSDLLVLDAAGRQQHVHAIRQRLDELHEYLRIGMPVYLVFTKCDLVAGFTEYFDDLNPELRSQVWGFSFPVEQTVQGSAAARFAEEFDLLLGRLNTRTLDRLHAEQDRSRRAAVLSFPMQLSAMREIAREFVEGVFTGHQYGATPLLRGVYLTSGTQEGTPIDRMMAAVARTFGVSAAQVRAPGAQSRTFFVQRLLKDVLFPESGFAGTDPALERRKVWLQVGAYGGVLLAMLLLLAGMATSYGRNRAYLSELDASLKSFPVDDNPSTATTSKEYFAKVLGRLEALSGSLDVARQYQGHVPLLMRFGLYQGHAMAGEVHDAYVRELNASLLPGVAAQLRQGLSNLASEPQALYYTLKGYLMLGEPRHQNADELVALTNIEWRKVFPADPVLQKALAKHFQVLVDAPGQLHALTLDNALVEQARATLRTADLPTLVYGNLKLNADSSDAPPLRLDKELGLLGNVFRRKSGTPLSEPLPSLFTQPVFQNEVNQGIEQSVKQFASDNWVLGSAPIDAVNQARLSQQVLALYQQDYIKAWDALLDDLVLQPVANIQDASAIAARLAGPSSPLKALLKVVRDNTNDLMRAPPADAADKAEDAAKKSLARKAAQNSLVARALASAAGAPTDAATEKPGQAISDHFDTINKLSEGAPGSAPIDHTLGVLDQLSKNLLTMSDFSSGAGQPNPQLLLAQQEAAQMPAPVAGLVSALTGKSQALVDTGTKGALDEQYQQQVAKDCADYTRGRYPFVAASRQDIPVQNFAELFGYGGRFDSFTKQSLDKLVDASGRTWKWKSGPGAVSGSAGLLAQAQAADAIKQMYFRNNGNVPEVAFTLMAPQLDAGIAKLAIDVDGQKFEYQPGGNTSMPMKWPGPQPGHVSISAWDASGTLLGTIDYQGDWAFFHALQAANLQRQSDLRFLASFDFGGHAAKVTLQAGNLKNPFLNTDVQRFRCGG